MGAYFITVCVRDRKGLLEQIVGNGGYDIPQMKLSEYGTILESYLNQMSRQYANITVDKYIIMPDHFHMILSLKEGGLSQATNPTNSEVSKFVSLLKRHGNRKYGENIWQASFYDQIICEEQDYQEIWDYIDTNVLRRIEKTR